VNPPESPPVHEKPAHDAPADALRPDGDQPATPARAPGSGAGLLRDLGTNLGAGLRLALLRPCETSALRGTTRQLLALFVLQLALSAAYDVLSIGWSGGRLDALALPAASFWALPLLLSAGVVATMRWEPALFVLLATAGFSLACWQALAAGALAWSADHWAPIDRNYPLLSWLPPAWMALAYGLCAVRMRTGVMPRRRSAIFVLCSALVLLPQLAVDPNARLWSAESDSQGEASSGPDAPQSEQTLYSQIGLLDDALDAVAPGQAGVTELFTISFGGDGSQDVFLREAVGADSVMAEVFDSGAHSVVLANSQAHPQEQPFATVSSLQRALATVADRMNGDEDVLALFLTSHATPDHHLVVSLPPYEFEDLTPERLRELLDEAGIRYRVVIISACYAGAFIGPLATRDTMVITASGVDNTSFGCRTDAQWTDFGRAYFAEALMQAASFEGAFRIATRRIAEREAREGLAPSAPQIFVGEGIREHLLRLETRRGGRILFATRSRNGRFQ